MQDLETRISWKVHTNVIIIVVSTVAGMAASDAYEGSIFYGYNFKHSKHAGGGKFYNELLDEVEQVCCVTLCIFCLLS